MSKRPWRVETFRFGKWSRNEMYGAFASSDSAGLAVSKWRTTSGSMLPYRCVNIHTAEIIELVEGES